MRNDYELLKSKGIKPAVYPGHAVTVAYCIVNAFQTYEEAFQRTEHNWAAALGDGRIPGSGGCVASALDFLRRLRQGATEEEAFQFADELWCTVDSQKNGGSIFRREPETPEQAEARKKRYQDRWREGQEQADLVKSLLLQHAAWWTP